MAKASYADVGSVLGPKVEMFGIVVWQYQPWVGFVIFVQRLQRLSYRPTFFGEYIDNPLTVSYARQ